MASPGSGGDAMRPLFHGQLVRLTAEDPEVRARLEARWERDSEFHRLADGEPARLASEKSHKESIEKRLEKPMPPNRFPFMIRALSDDKIIGFLGLWVDLFHADAFVGIAIGERDYWGKGYGTDAMRTILHYGFTEINLRRVTLTVFEYNPRAIRSYEKAGFRQEGCLRQFLNREGRRWDMLYMGILREEWEALP